MLLSYAYVDDDAFQCDNSARRVKIFFTCSPEEKLVRDFPKIALI